jgi:hypothetical protein
MRRYVLGPDGTFHDGLLMDLLAEEFIRSNTLRGASLAQMISNVRRDQWLVRI